MPNVYEDIENTNTPPEAAVIRRASSYSDFYRVVQEQLSKDGRPQRKKSDKWNRRWEALDLPDSSAEADGPQSAESKNLESYDEQLLDASQQEYLYATQAMGR